MQFSSNPGDHPLAVFLLSVPELTRSSDIKLNQRLLLKGDSNRLLINLPDNYPRRPGPHEAKPSGDYTPLGGFVFDRSLTRTTRLRAYSE